MLIRANIKLKLLNPINLLFLKQNYYQKNCKLILNNGNFKKSSVFPLPCCFNFTQKSFLSIEQTFSRSPDQDNSILNRKLDELKDKNILVFSTDSYGGYLITSLSVFVAFLLFIAAYNAYYIYGSIRLSKDDENETLFKKFLNLMSSERFRLSLSGVIGLLGK